MNRSVHSLSHTRLLSMSMGQLVPIGVQAILPGDKHVQSSTLVIRALPMVAPPFHKTLVDVFHIFCPDRINWTDSQDFYTGGRDGNTAPVRPFINTNEAIGGLFDYLGVTPNVSQGVSALPVRAYQRAYLDHFQDSQLGTPPVISLASGADTTTETALQRGCWPRDPFTTCRPEPLLGADITIPVAGNAPVNFPNAVANEILISEIERTDGAFNGILQTNAAGVVSNSTAGSGAADPAHLKYDMTGVVADLAAVTGIPVSTLRRSFAMYRFKENRNMYGSDYKDVMASWGVHVPDDRLQRSEILGHGRTQMQFSEVLQTAEGTDPVGELKGHGIATIRSNRFKREFTEHGILLTLVILRPVAIYMDGTERLWYKQSKEDFFNPEFAHLGDQEVYNREVQASHSVPDGVFGYQPRDQDSREKASSVHGLFRTTLAHWHMGRTFTGDVALNESFVLCTPSPRIFADTDVNAQNIVVMAHHTVRSLRLVPKYPSPKIL